MKYWYQQPNQQLSAYVRTVLILEGFSPPDGNELPLFTSGMPALLCRMEKDPTGNEHVSQLTLFGKSIPDASWETDTNTTLIAYFFKPFALTGMFNISAARLAEAPLDLCDWHPHATNALRTQLAYSGTTSRKIAVLDHLLMHRLAQQEKECAIIQYATDHMMCNPGAEIISGLLNELNLHERTFQRMFKKYVGVTPNQFRRICQFQQSFAQLRAGQFGSMAEVAYDNGFADQSHFIRSFKEFTQTTPNSYLRFGLKGEGQ